MAHRACSCKGTITRDRYGLTKDLSHGTALGAAVSRNLASIFCRCEFRLTADAVADFHGVHSRSIRTTTKGSRLPGILFQHLISSDSPKCVKTEGLKGEFRLLVLRYSLSGSVRIILTHPEKRTLMDEAQQRKVTIGELKPLNGPVQLVEYDADWPSLFLRQAERIRPALGDRVLHIAHVGSTSVPRLAAKPIIDILLVVKDSADETTYVPELEAAGYVLRLREPLFHEHRMFKGPDTDINLHVFSQGCPEVERMLLFRDRLRNDDADRELYERTKRELAKRQWKYVQSYANAKAPVVEEIISRARRAMTAR